MEFEKQNPLLPMVNINTSTPNKHVAEEERKIRIVKEWCRGIMATLPFLHFPQQIIINLVQFAVI